MSEDLSMGDLARMSDEEWAAFEEKMSETMRPEILELATKIREFLMAWNKLDGVLVMSSEQLDAYSKDLETIAATVRKLDNA